MNYETDVVQGNPAPTIVEYVERYDYELVVMPTQARKGVSRYLAGSMTEKVVRLSPVPVLTAQMQPDERLNFPYENVLIPTDGSSSAVYAAHHGLLLAASLDATVHILSVVDDTPLGLDVRSTVAGKESEQTTEDAVSDIESEAEKQGIADVVQHIKQGSPVEGILNCIESNDIDAVVMGTTGKQGTERIMLGSVAEKTVRSAPIPVITVREAE